MAFSEKLAARVRKLLGLRRSLAQPGVRVFDLTGRAMKGWILVGSRRTATAPALRRWVGIAVTYAESLSAKR